MGRIVKALILILVAGGILTAGLYFFGLLSFPGAFEKKYSREELVTAFKEHEKAFADLESFFVANLSKVKGQKVSFGLEKGNQISLNIFPEEVVIEGQQKMIGANDVKIGSSKLDSALEALGWTNETLKVLRDKLSKTNNDWITATGEPENTILVYSNQSSWGTYNYAIYDMPITDSLVQAYGAPLGNSDFSRRVVLDYRAAL